MKIFVVVNLTFAGFHRWADAPNCVHFLRSYHRHLFTVKAVKQVSHEEREIEIITLQGEIQNWCIGKVANQDWHEASCETIAREIMLRFGLHECEVLEDGENGARLINDNSPLPN